MAPHIKSPAKPRATQKVAPISLKDELDADEPVEAPADLSFAAPAEPLADIDEPVEAVEPIEIVEPVAFEAAAPAEPMPFAEPIAPVEPVILAATVTASLAPPALLAPEAPAAAASAPADIDPSALPLKTLDLFSENAAAVLDFALALGAARSVGDAFELQSRFASERYSSLVRQAGEFAELTRRLAFQNSPVRLSFSAFIA